MTRITVVVCTHNPRLDYLERVLSALKSQTLASTEWELLLIDNASYEPVSRRIDIAWHPHARIVREDKLGLSNARARGISESKGEFLIFVDDDNIVSFNYLEQALKIAERHPQLGIWGGAISGEFETLPSDDVRPYLHCLALRKASVTKSTSDWTDQEAEPYGAGVCIRRSAALAYRDYFFNSELRVNDRSGKTLTSGGDTEMAYFVCSLGMEMGVFPQLHVTHLIPATRLSEEYIARIAEGLETSSMLLFYKWGRQMPPSTYSPFALVRFSKHFLFSRGLKRKLALGRMRAARIVRRMIRAQSSLDALPASLSVRKA